MPSYELMVLFRRMAKPEVLQNVTRIADGLINQGTVIRKMENLGERKLAYRMRSKEIPYYDAQYMIFHVNTHKENVPNLKDLLSRDSDVIRFGFQQNPEFDVKENFECVDPMWPQTSPFQRW